MPTYTTTYSLGKPVVGADEDAWGDTLNTSLDAIDDILDGTTPVTGIDINSGTLDGVTIGGTTAGAGTFTTLTATTSITGTLATAAQTNITSVGTLTSLDVGGTITSDGLTVDTNTLHVDATNNRVGIKESSPVNHLSFGDVGGLQDDANTLYVGSNFTETGTNYRKTNYSTQTMYNSADGSIRFRNAASGTGGTAITWNERMRIDSSGNVGIGTSSPTTQLMVEDTGSTSVRVVSSDGTDARVKLRSGGTADMQLIGDNDEFYISLGSTERLRIDSSGNVGIGAASPSSTFRTSIYGDGSSIIGGVEFRNAAAGGSTFTIGHSSATSPSATLNVTDAANLIFKTSNTEAMRIDSSGNVGIGTSSPAAGLHIDNPSNAAITAILDTDNTAVKLVFRNNTETGNNVQIGADGSSLVALTNALERMRITSSGNVGIGTSSPSAPLTVYNSSTPRITVGYSGTQNHYLGWDSSKLTFQADPQNLNAASAILFSVDGTEAMRIDSSGHLLVGTTSAIQPSNGGISIAANYSGTAQGIFDIGHGSGVVSGSRFAGFCYAGGVIGEIVQSGTTGVSYNTSSDYRLKENVVELTGATDRLKQLEPKRFNFIADADTTVDGFLAHEVQSVVPEAITGTHNEVDADGNPVYQGIDQSKLVPLLVATIKELEARITALENA